MRSLILLLTILLVMSLSPAIVSAQGFLSQCRFYGEVLLNGTPVANGTVITIVVQDDVYTTTTPAIYGDSTYAILVVPPEGKIYDDGTPVVFIIDKWYALETGIWETGLNIPLNVTASTTLSPTITPSPSLSPILTPVPTITPYITATPAVSPTPAPTSTSVPRKAPLSAGRLVALVIFGIVDLLLIGALVYMVWRFFLRREKKP